MELFPAATRGAVSQNALFGPNQNQLIFSSKSIPLTHSSFPPRTNLGLQYSSNFRSRIAKDESRDVAISEAEVTNNETPSMDVDGQVQSFVFLDQFNKELNLENAYSVLLLGGGSFVAIWFATAVIGAIDSIPVFPEMMKVAGLGYSVWFGARYLLFKKNRDELAMKIEEIKQEVLGYDGD